MGLLVRCSICWSRRSNNFLQSRQTLMCSSPDTALIIDARLLLLPLLRNGNRRSGDDAEDDWHDNCVELNAGFVSFPRGSPIQIPRLKACQWSFTKEKYRNEEMKIECYLRKKILWTRSSSCTWRHRTICNDDVCGRWKTFEHTSDIAWHRRLSPTVRQIARGLKHLKLLFCEATIKPRASV